jgi:outer membrane murein-binding lipoprotein Lpp
MKTSGLSLAIAVLAFAASTIYLAVQLSEERAHSEQLVDATRALNARIAELEKVRDEGPVRNERHVREHQFAARRDAERSVASTAGRRGRAT